eukprot:509804-Amphidinium_carterae.1
MILSCPSSHHYLTILAYGGCECSGGRRLKPSQWWTNKATHAKRTRTLHCSTCNQDSWPPAWVSCDHGLNDEG